MSRVKTIIFIISLMPIWVLSQTIVINEFMSGNASTLQDADGDYSDWIELYNNTDQPVNLLNYSLSDDAEEVRKWIFPSADIQPHEFIILFASGKDIQVGDELHTNFKISQSGEFLVLGDELGGILHLIPPHEITSDLSLSCIPDGQMENMLVSYPSPGESNQEMLSVFASHPSAYYAHQIELELSCSNENHQIYYSINGSVPNNYSHLYSGAILLGPSANLSESISLIPTTPLEGPWPLPTFVWNEPLQVNNAHVIRFAAFENGIQMTPVSTKTYFIDDSMEERYSFPVLSLVTDSLNLFQYDTGIYIPGQKFDELGWGWFPYGNYRERGVEWERDAHVSFFEDNGDLIFETDAGMRIRGQGSAANPQKSFGLYFRKEYGLNKIEYPLFENSQVDTYKRLVMRSSGNDFLETHFRDALLTDLLKPLDMELQNFRPSVLFINGEYWGIHNIREKFDDHYFKYHFNIEEDNINILGIALEIEEGTVSNYPEIMAYVNSNDMSLSESYDYIDERVEIPNMIDFLVAEIYYANYDWPCNNYKKWKTNDEGSKWRFLIYDLDLSFGFHSDSKWDKPSLVHALTDGDDWPNCGASNQLFRGLMENERFVNEFIDRFAYHMNHTFKSSLVLQKIDEYTDLFEPEMSEHIDRWGYSENMDQWYAEIEVMKEFARERPCFMRTHIMNYFDLESFGFTCDSVDSVPHLYTTSDFKIYPNPSFDNYVMVEHIPFDEEPFQLDIYSYDGKFVSHHILNDRKTRLSLADLPNGFYVINIYNDKQEFRYKLVISR